MSRLVLFNVLLDRLDSRHIVRASFGGLDHNGLRDFARGIVGDRDDGAVGDGGVGEDVGFEFGGGDL